MARNLPQTPLEKKEVKSSVAVIETFNFPKLDCHRYCRDIYFDFVAPSVTPEEFYYYFMDKTGWPKIKFVSIISPGYQYSFSINKLHTIYFRVKERGDVVNGYEFEEWVRPFVEQKKDTRNQEDIALNNIIKNSRILLGIQPSESLMFGFE